MAFKMLWESTRQKLSLGDRSFKPTPNVRNPAMLAEAEEFARHLQSYRNLLLKYERQMNSFLSSIPAVCNSNLPRVWEAVEGTTMCEPTSPEITSRHPYRTGGEFDEVLMADASEIMRRRIEGIIRPIDRWNESLAVVKMRMRKLESLRMQVDSRRRRVHARFLKALRRMTASEAAGFRSEAEGRVQGAQAGPTGVQGQVLEGGAPAGTGGHTGVRGATPLGQAGVAAAFGEQREANRRFQNALEEELNEDDDLEYQRKREDYAREAMNQHRQLEAVSETYREQEQLVFEQLSGLVRDAAYFKSYMAAGLLVVKDTVVATLVALGATKRPLPGFSDREPGEEELEVAGQYGRIASINDLIEDIPPVLREGGRRVPESMRPGGTMPAERIRPTRLTAQPLQVAADDVTAREARNAPVPPVQKGASAIPADRLAQVMSENANGTGVVPGTTQQTTGGNTGGMFGALQQEVANA